MSETYPIKTYMTQTPYTIGKDIPLSKATEMMRDHGIRHLPVLSRGKLIGILTDRDISLALSVHPVGKVLNAGDIMTEDPYSVAGDCPLDQVVAQMSKRKLGCAVIEDERGGVMGVFTAVDALELLGDWLRKEPLSEPKMRLIS